MNADNLFCVKSSLEDILPKNVGYRDTKLNITKIDKGYELEYGEMYEAPPVSLSQLNLIAELFGTLNVNLDNYSEGGCETCDYGSNYGHTIQIREITQNEDFLKKYVNQNLYKE